MNDHSTRGRWILGLAAIILVVASLLQWWQTGGNEVTQLSNVGISDGRGFIIFLAAIATLLLLTLPYAAEHPVAVDHPLVYLSLMLVMIAAFVWATFGLILEKGTNLFPFPPQRGIGYWLTALGLIIFARGVLYLAEAYRRGP